MFSIYVWYCTFWWIPLLFMGYPMYWRILASKHFWNYILVSQVKNWPLILMLKIVWHWRNIISSGIISYFQVHVSKILFLESMWWYMSICMYKWYFQLDSVSISLQHWKCEEVCYIGSSSSNTYRGVWFAVILYYTIILHYCILTLM